MGRTPQDNSFRSRVGAFSSALDICIPAWPAPVSLMGKLSLGTDSPAFPQGP